MKMNTTAVSFIVALSLTAAVLFSVANAANEPVLDVDGDEVRTGVEYYAVAAIIQNGGGLALGRTSREPCPEVVVQRRRAGDYGIPVIFSNANSSGDVVRLSTDINIEFVPIRDRLCLTSTVWKLDDYDELRGKWWVTTGGVKGNPGPSTLNNWFKIEKFVLPEGMTWYHFRFCPSVCDSCQTLCSDIVTYEDEDLFRFALTKDEAGISWIFMKATTIKQVVNAK